MAGSILSMALSIFGSPTALIVPVIQPAPIEEAQPAYTTDGGTFAPKVNEAVDGQ